MAHEYLQAGAGVNNKALQSCVVARRRWEGVKLAACSTKRPREDTQYYRNIWEHTPLPFVHAAISVRRLLPSLNYTYIRRDGLKHLKRPESRRVPRLLPLIIQHLGRLFLPVPSAGMDAFAQKPRAPMVIVLLLTLTFRFNLCCVGHGRVSLVAPDCRGPHSPPAAIRIGLHAFGRCCYQCIDNSQVGMVHRRACHDVWIYRAVWRFQETRQQGA